MAGGPSSACRATALADRLPPRTFPSLISISSWGIILFGSFNGLDFLGQLSSVRCRGSSARARELRSASARGSRLIRCSLFFLWSICDANRFLASLE